MATMFRSSLVFPALSKGFLRPPTKPATCRPCIRQQFYSTPPLLGRLTDVIREDHRDLGAYCKHILEATDMNEQARFQNLFICEELVVYPVLEKHVANGKILADRDRAEHQAVKEKLYWFQERRPEDLDFEPALSSLMEDLRRHIRTEEEEDLMFTPTRSHPSAPNKPPFETVVGLMEAPLDKLRDLFATFPTEEEKAKAKAKADS
ncbi:HHE domain-containing protein [Colletotrichum graminicola]|uniref:HHE domain-containing protein n=1 Tax=Colletotrichum graminicola (strain M1.001 / M2 / FGSC 10212) TaxID=645133 RepID=E3QMM3_COLGM|nr:HHE domain-containing protein [Colletotrichum graminicola M1.001]EFQ32111.1 HHE domain-containing protein [Colletotrichum graminicola M1.001]WDK16995.1 HHE domain-containing protein [Colletotrichum graminicola]